MWQQIILLLFTFTFASASPSETLNLKFTEYDVKSGSDECWGGDLRLNETQTLMLGARPLALTIDRAEELVDEGNCSYTYRTKVEKGSLTQTVESVCGDLPNSTRNVSVKKTESGFDYAVVLRNAAGKVTKSIQCKMVPVKK